MIDTRSIGVEMALDIVASATVELGPGSTDQRRPTEFIAETIAWFDSLDTS